jgi:hypothetical protein
LEDGEECNLWQICEDKEDSVDEAREEGDGEETGTKQRPEKRMGYKVQNTLRGKRGQPVRI